MGIKMMERVLLLLLSTPAAMLKGSSDERDYSDISTSASVGQSSQVRLAKGGRVFLLPLPQESPQQASAWKDPPWGKGIRLGGVGHIPECDPKWSGIDSNRLLLKKVAEHVGPTHCISMPESSDFFGEMLKGALDIIQPALTIIHDRMPFLYPHEPDNVCLIVKRNEPIVQSIEQAFSGTTWAATGACVALVVAALRLAGRRGVVLESLRTFISGGFVVHRRRSISNYPFLLLSVFGLIMVTAFCAKFMSYLAVSAEASQPQTLEEANSRLSRLHDSTTFIKKMLVRDERKHMQELGAKVVSQVYEKYSVMRYIASSHEAAVIMPQNLYELYRRHPLWVEGNTGRSLTYQVPQCILSPAYKVFIISPSWTHAKRFDALLQWAIEAGMGLRAKSDAWRRYQRQKQIVSEEPPSDEPKPLGLSAILQPVVVLGAGLGLAAAVFMVECAVHRWRHR